MAAHENLTGDPYPWVTIEEDGTEFRTAVAHEDGIDENGNEWEGWVFAPRPKAVWQNAQ